MFSWMLKNIPGIWAAFSLNIAIVVVNRIKGRGVEHSDMQFYPGFQALTEAGEKEISL